ncbi:SprT family zinc-dependent metalloprotease [Sansalvadorimonas verongulae]|uniref:SprT family zinc-dependent metalloprotease n=1 Tax=Sansalvadorimonas verongulae TaxID=2172824 RepID=UPI0012BCA155|nr:SprT-like domain-containing protein [Sansalvadorimonas verongulae]MTI12740.1 SprT family protein [Sansalvadorimonas verongulae]
MGLPDIHTRIQQLLNIASAHYGMPFSPPRILVNLSGADAGQAIPEDNLLRFNQDFCRHNPQHFIHHIVGHETAHLVAQTVYGHTIAAHGQEWQGVMKRVFHLPPATTHNYDLRYSPRYRFIYGCRCPKRETPLSAIRHNRQKRGIVYFCADCGTRYSYLYEARSQAPK